MSQNAVAAVSWLLEQREPEARRLAAQQLVKVKGREVADLLVKALGDDDWRVRKEATNIARVVERRDDVIAALVRALDEKENVGLRNAAVEALAAIGVDSIGAVIKSLESLDADGKKLAVEVLGAIPDERSVRALAIAVKDIDINVRSAAAEQLGNAAAAGGVARAVAADALMALLNSEHETFLRVAVLEALGKLDARMPWSLLAPLVEDPVLKRYAVAAAARSRDSAATETLVRAIMDGPRSVSREAVIAVGDRIHSTPEDTKFIEDVRRELRLHEARNRVFPYAREFNDLRVRGAALVLLGLCGSSADIPMLIDALTEDDMAERAEHALRLFGSDALGPVLAIARGEAPERRASALSIVPSLSPRADSELRITLHQALADETVEVRTAALRVVSSNGSSEDFRRVIPLTVHADPRVASAATAALAGLAARFPFEAHKHLDAIDVESIESAAACIIVGALAKSNSLREGDSDILERALSTGDPRTRRHAVEALALVNSDEAADSVGFALADEERDVQLAAIRALGRMGRSEPLSALIAAAREPSLVAAALRALSEADAEKCYQAAAPLIRNQDPAIASAAVEALGNLGTSKARDALIEALHHPESDVVKAALSEVANAPDARTLARLGMCLDHESWEVRRLTAELLGADGSANAQALLRARLERESDPHVRESIAAALSGRSSDEVY